MVKTKKTYKKEDTFVIVIPAYNEEKCIEKVVGSWMANVITKHPGSEMLIINDGSRDNTRQILDKLKKKYKELKVIHKVNEGHGATIIRGYLESTKTPHEWVFQTDSDDQFFSEDFDKLWKSRHKSNFILGYRAKRNDPLHRLVISRLIFIFNLIVFGVYIKDANIPYRLMKKAYLKILLQKLPKNIFAPNIFLSILAVKVNQNLLNIQVRHKERKSGQVSIVRWKLLKACFNDVKKLLLFRLRLNDNINIIKKEIKFIKDAKR